MKLKALLVALFLTLTTSAFAQFFPARVDVVVLPQQVAAQVVNPYLQPVICNGQVFGQTFGGQIFTTYFTEQYIPAGGFRYAYVQTTALLPFATGWANIHCRFAHYW